MAHSAYSMIGVYNGKEYHDWDRCIHTWVWCDLL